MKQIVPLTLSEANWFVALKHRHHQPVQGHKYSIGLTENDDLVGVAIVGRPVARHRDDGMTLEVTRLATDGTKNACSALYAAAWRAARALGYKKIGTYILAEEPGVTLKAAGWRFMHQTKGDSWIRNNRKRIDKAPTSQKQLWEKDCA